MAMKPVTGVNVLLKVDTTGAGTTFTEVACQRGATLNRNADTVEASYKGSGAWKTYLQGLKGWSVDCDGLYAFGQTEFSALETAFLNGTVIKVELVDEAGKGYMGDAIIVDFPIEAPYDGEMTYKLQLQGTGALTEATGV